MEKFADVYGMEKKDFVLLIKEYKDCMSRINHPSKNTLYAMSKAMFVKYNLNQYQEDYFKMLNTPNPIFLKKMNEVLENFIWNWAAFFEKHKVAH
jgi:hypothetical protein